MFGNRNRRRKATALNTLVGTNTEIRGDLEFSGGLHVDGVVRGNVLADKDDDAAVLTLSQHGRIVGEVRVPNVVVNGTIEGDVHASVRVQLANNARVTGNVYYGLIEMAMGAEVNGNLVHRAEEVVLALSHQPAEEAGGGEI